MIARVSTAAALLVLAAAGAQAQNADTGKSQFAQCRACHTVDAGQNRVGPHLFGIIGRKLGTAEKFNYSKAMKDAGEKGLVWDEEKLMEYLEDPGAFLKKAVGRDTVDNKMPNRFPNKELRANIIAYLKTVK